jgi:alpha-1,6-mannosyltransferase
LLCAPVVNAWYLVWLLPFAVIYPSRWAWVASVSVLLSYAVGLNLAGSSLGAYELPVWIITLEYGVILLALLIDLRARKKTLTH